MSEPTEQRRVLTPEEVKARSKSNIRLAVILGVVAIAFFVSAWFIDIA